MLGFVLWMWISCTELIGFGSLWAALGPRCCCRMVIVRLILTSIGVVISYTKRYRMLPN